MLIKQAPEYRWSQITPKDVYLNRRRFFTTAAGGLLLAATDARAAKIDNVQKGALSTTGEKLTSQGDATSYNNYYEFGTSKADPARNAHRLKTANWKVSVEGACAKPKTYDLDSLMKLAPQEERVYRHRCVEAWSMVIPWRGIMLADVLKRAEPAPGAKFVEFTTLYDPTRMPGQRSDVLRWPYREGLRLDEAMHPLTMLATGVYGRDLPNQNGAPLRLVTPWKYGFKGIKSIVRIRLTDRQPETAWNDSAPNEYGFYCNVNPTVDHPRWSQAKERRIGEFLRRPTLMFNGYADQVASLYTGMDLRKNY